MDSKGKNKEKPHKWRVEKVLLKFFLARKAIWQKEQKNNFYLFDFLYYLYPCFISGY